MASKKVKIRKSKLGPPLRHLPDNNETERKMGSNVAYARFDMVAATGQGSKGQKEATQKQFLKAVNKRKGRKEGKV